MIDINTYTNRIIKAIAHQPDNMGRHDNGLLNNFCGWSIAGPLPLSLTLEFFSWNCKLNHNYVSCFITIIAELRLTYRPRFCTMKLWAGLICYYCLWPWWHGCLCRGMLLTGYAVNLAGRCVRASGCLSGRYWGSLVAFIWWICFMHSNNPRRGYHIKPIIWWRAMMGIYNGETWCYHSTKICWTRSAPDLALAIIPPCWIAFFKSVIVGSLPFLLVSG